MGKLKNKNRNNALKQIMKKTDALSGINCSAEVCESSLLKKQN